MPDPVVSVVEAVPSLFRLGAWNFSPKKSDMIGVTMAHFSTVMYKRVFNVSTSIWQNEGEDYIIDMKIAVWKKCQHCRDWSWCTTQLMYWWLYLSRIKILPSGQLPSLNNCNIPTGLLFISRRFYIHYTSLQARPNRFLFAPRPLEIIKSHKADGDVATVIYVLQYFPHMRGPLL